MMVIMVTTDNGNVLTVMTLFSEHEFQLSPELFIHGRLYERCLQ